MIFQSLKIGFVDKGIAAGLSAGKVVIDMPCARRCKATVLGQAFPGACGDWPARLC